MPLNPGLLRLDLESLLHQQLIPIPLPPGTVQLVTGPGVIVFKLNNIVAWTIDEKLFGGTPVLTSGPVKGDFRIELKGALYPGTSLSADFVCILAPKGILGTPMDMRMTLGAFHGHTILERWLAGSVALSSAVTLNDPVCPLGAGGKLTCKGTGSADFTPNWKTALSGGIVASITGLGAPQDSGALTVRLLTPLDPSLRGTPKNKRSLITLARGTHAWDLKPAPLSLPIGKLSPRPNLFDRIDIEAGENSAADTDHTLLAQSQATDKLEFAPGGGLTDSGGKPLIVAFAAPRYAIDFETPQTILTAHFPDGPVWMRAAGFAMEVRDPGTVPAFEVDATNGAVTTIVCAPVLLQAAAPLSGDLAARPLPVDGPTRLPFVAAPGTTPGWGVLAAKGVAGQPRVSLPQFAVAVVRPRDLLSLEFDFFNLALQGGDDNPPRLVRIDRGKEAFVLARFNAPQNIAEQAFFESAVPPPVTGPPVLALAAGPSRLAFKLGAGVDSVEYSVANLLDWKQYDLNVARAAALPDPPPFPVNPPAPAPPQSNETAIEAPWRLVISPNSTGGFAHATAEVTHGDQTELWHTRLGVKKIVGGSPTVDEQDGSTRTIRALWSPDFKPGPPHAPGGGPFLMSLDANARDQIVVRSSDFSIPNLLPPKAVDVDRLMLSSLGAWMDVDGRWTAQAPFDLEEWRHRAAMGRDSYVKVVHAGHLCPFGHRAVLVVVTERKFLENPAGNTTAYLIQREFIVVKEPEKDYGYLAGVPGQGRNFPYRRVRITTLVTPNLDANNHLHFFPKVGTIPFLFHLTGTDREGRTSEFTAPLVWTSLGEANEIAGLNDYLTAPSAARKRDMGGQSVAFAQSSKPGDTSLHTSTMTFSVAPLVPAPRDQPSYYPILNPSDSAEVTIPALQQINGSASTVAIKLFPDYVNNDFKKGGVFLELTNPLGVAFGGDKTGGVATPNLNVGGLSRSHGTVSGAGAALGTFAGGKFDPAAYFGGIADAKLLGFIPLTAIIDVIADVTATPEKAPKLVTTRTATEIVTNLAWKPDVHDWSALSFAKLEFTAPPADPANPAHMEIDVVIRTPIGGGNPDATVQGHLRTFDLELVKVIVLHFKSVSFTAQPGKKLDLTADLATPPVEFAGDLSFLNQLQKLIPSSGFSDPPSVDVTSTGVTVGYSLAIPSVGVGVFSVENIRFSAALELSFVGDPLRFRLAFSEREHPFLVTVSLLGGGGFFALHLGPDGIEMLEASIEFGANVSLDLVVASANVHIMAGVYLKLDFASNASQLTGYLRAGGSANVLGLITVSVEFYLGFTYYFGSPCKIAGEASVTVEIDILFFSASVSVSLRREFEDPQVSFADLIQPADWDHYCDAFAA